MAHCSEKVAMRDYRYTPSSRFTFRSALAPFDCVWAAAAPYVAFALRDVQLLLGPDRVDVVVLFSVAAFFCTLVAMATFRLGEGLTRFFSYADLGTVLCAAVGGATLTSASLFVITRSSDVPRSILLLHALVLAAGWLVGRLVARLIARRKAAIVSGRLGAAAPGTTRPRALMIGINTTAWLFLKVVEEDAGNGISVIGFLDSRQKFAGRTLAGYPVIGQPLMLDQVIDEYAVHGVHIDRVIVAVRRCDIAAAEMAAIDACQARRGIRIDFIGELLGLVGGASAETTGSGSRVVTLQAVRAADAHPPGAIERPRGAYWAIKRLIDIVVALAIGVVVLPVAALTALLVALTIGFPTVFWQQRVGLGGREFMIYKFRTLRAPFDRHGRARSDDARLGAVGRWLRATRLDELPQLFNVLAGDMSIIGPRPLLPIDLPRSDLSRLSVRPGLTGWAQVNGGKSIDAETKNKLDRWYIDNASLWLDCEVLLLTLLTVVRGEKIGKAAIARAEAAYRLAAAQPANGPDFADATEPQSVAKRASATAAQ